MTSLTQTVVLLLYAVIIFLYIFIWIFCIKNIFILRILISSHPGYNFTPPDIISYPGYYFIPRILFHTPDIISHSGYYFTPRILFHTPDIISHPGYYFIPRNSLSAANLRHENAQDHALRREGYERILEGTRIL